MIALRFSEEFLRPESTTNVPVPPPIRTTFGTLFSESLILKEFGWEELIPGVPSKVRDMDLFYTKVNIGENYRIQPISMYRLIALHNDRILLLNVGL
jgi:hypothetical protein